MEHIISIDVVYDKVNHDHQPCTYVGKANVQTCCGGYGTVGTMTHKRALIAVDLPDEVTKSAEFMWPMALPGRNSRTGSGDLCFVVCGETARAEYTYLGQLDAKALIEQALASGIWFIWPGENGDMQKRQIPYRVVRMDLE